ncbi:helix-turn-helix domain-containing protein [Amycolatopsis sp. WQ 127309]|uniref:helix-turn-helix domain-containing protein n=1 Tax=Amycolatopsis sp. WQ 127309 TaxID=2932773 RepID=UPI001FF1DD64|nr:helix-turn-helix domain-containing protein [Amycolatopsis sp. WQ 127309]UOZ06294.1 helix-turn-helix domain-containing protein [Amycolatopsis sp. WQ 127309]
MTEERKQRGDREAADPGERDRSLARAYELGASIEELAEQEGLSYTWMRRKLRNAGAELRRRPAPKPCPIPLDQLADEYHAGASIMVLARTYGLYYKRVRELLLGHGVQLRPSTRAKPDS